MVRERRPLTDWGKIMIGDVEYSLWLVSETHDATVTRTYPGPRW